MKRILVNIRDLGRESQPALEAAKAASNSDSRVHLIHNVFHEDIDGPAAAGEELLKEARELLIESRKTQLDRLAHEHFGDGADGVLTWSENAWQEILRFAISRRCDLVVTDSQRRNRWERLTLGKDDWQLIRHAPMPLLVARADAPKHYKEIVVAVDPMHSHDKPAELDRSLMEGACALAKRHQSSISVINVVLPVLMIPPAAITPSAPLPEETQDLVAVHERRVSDLIQSVRCNVADRRVVSGVPQDEIVGYVADRGADLLVIGAVSRSRLSRLLIGNTAEKVLDRVPCDLLIIKPPAFNINMRALASLTNPPSLL